ncbi:hypothetical protein Tco_0860537 [Tanacetum coccineum]|uniref:Reverse transcriptase domain-containing protein n=1 Tax=Tanacetum coccineum TaxID=301880 RepID=A0ABQ5BF81_9ASTR
MFPTVSVIDDESSHEEEIHEMSFITYSNPLFDLDEEINSSEFNPIHNEDPDSTPKNDRFDTESYLLESLINRDTFMTFSPKIDFLLEEFPDELALLKPSSPGVNKVDYDPKEEIRHVERLLYENSTPRPPKEINVENSIESFHPSPIPVEDSNPFMEEIDIFLASDDSTPPGVESDYDSEGDILLLEELLNDDLVPLAEYNHFTFDVEPDTAVKNDFDELNEDECFDPGGGENVVFLNVEEDDSFTFTIRTFLPFVTYPEVRIRQISQENRQKRANTDTRTEECARAGSQSQKVNPQSKSTLEGQKFPKGEEAQRMMGFVLKALTEVAQMSQSRIATLAIRVRSFGDLTDENHYPIIENDQGSRCLCVEGSGMEKKKVEISKARATGSMHLQVLGESYAGINKADYDPEEEIRHVEILLYENSSPRPPEELNVENSIKSFHPSLIHVEG